MLSRVADSIYWMSRYIERAENVARVVGVNNQLRLDLPEQAAEQWDPMVQVSGDDAAFRSRYDRSSRTNVIQFLAFDHLNPNSIVSCVARARENARSVREALSSEFSTRQGRTRVWMKPVSCGGMALAQRSAFPWCRELVSELDRESREHPVLRGRLVR